jgi:hypothetical protein
MSKIMKVLHCKEIWKSMYINYIYINTLSILLRRKSMEIERNSGNHGNHGNHGNQRKRFPSISFRWKSVKFNNDIKIQSNIRHDFQDFQLLDKSKKQIRKGRRRPILTKYRFIKLLIYRFIMRFKL